MSGEVFGLGVMLEYTFQVIDTELMQPVDPTTLKVVFGRKGVDPIEITYPSAGITRQSQGTFTGRLRTRSTG